MNTITSRYNAFKKPSLGAIPALKRAVRGMKFRRQEINNAFKKYVPDRDYDKSERDEILHDLYHSSDFGKVAEIALKNKGQEN